MKDFLLRESFEYSIQKSYFAEGGDEADTKASLVYKHLWDTDE